MRGFGVALRRQATVVWRRGPSSLVALGGMPLIGTGIAVAASGDGLLPGPRTTQVLTVLITVAALTGAALTYQDLVSEWSILRRDWRVGVGAIPLLLAKATVFGGVCTVLSASVVIVFAALRDLPAEAFSVSPVLMLFLTLVSTMAGSMAVGMVVSAVSASLERAVTLNTLLAVLQVALNGSLLHVTGWLHLADVLPARLGFAALAAYLDLNRVRPPGAHHDALWNHNTARAVLPLVAIGALLVALTLVAMVIVEVRWRSGHERATGPRRSNTSLANNVVRLAHGRRRRASARSHARSQPARRTVRPVPVPSGRMGNSA